MHTPCFHLWQLENVHYSVFINSISSHTAMPIQLKPNVGTPLTDSLELLKTIFELSKSFYSRTTRLQTGKKVIGIMYIFYLRLPHFICVDTST